MRPLTPRFSYRVLSALARRMAGVTALLTLTTIAILPTAHAAQWMDVATISSTLTNTAGRLCVGGGGTDIGCPTTAPLLDSAAGLLTVPGDIRITGNLYVSGSQQFDGVTFSNGGVSATGTVTATSFTGSGAGLSGIPASAVVGLSTDRIVSDSANVVAGNGGTISFTTGGISGTAYIDTTGRFVAAGVSTTGSISGTNGYFSNRLGIGTISPVAPLHVEGRAYVGFGTNVGSINDYVFQADGKLGITGFGSQLEFNDGGVRTQISPEGIWINKGSTATFNVINSNGVMMGINTEDPSTTLHVSGTLKIASGGETCDANRLGAIRYATGSFDICKNTTIGWEPLATATSSTTPSIDTGLSGSIVFRDQSGYLKAYNTFSISSTTRSVGIGAGPPAALGASGLYVSGSLQTNDELTVRGIANLNKGILFNQGSAGAANMVYLGSSTPGAVNASLGMFAAGVGSTTANQGAYFVVRGNTFNDLGNQRGAMLFTAGNPTSPFGYDGSIQFWTGNEVRRMIIDKDGRIGIGTAETASTTLHVSGTLRIANSGETCDIHRIGAIKYQSNAFYVCQNTANGWESLATTGENSLADRITSNSQAGVIANASGYISLTTGGVTGTAYFAPNARLVTTEISTTGTISATDGYFTALRVGSPNNITNAISPFQSYATISGNYSAIGGVEMRNTNNGANADFRFVISDERGAGGTHIAFGMPSSNNTNLLFGSPRNQLAPILVNANSDANARALALGTVRPFPVIIGTNNAEAMRITSTGLAGIGTNSPSTTLHVSGTLRIASGNETCDANRTGAIRYASGQFYVCRNGTSWETMVAGASGTADTDRITSGTTSVIASNNTSVTINTAGVERVVIGTNGNVGIAQQPLPNKILAVSGTIHASIGFTSSETSLGSSSTANTLELGYGATTNKYAYIDLAGDTTYNDYGLRIIRNNTGANASSNITHRGTGNLNMETQEAAPIAFLTSSAERMRITSTGLVGIGTSSPQTDLEIRGMDSTPQVRVRNGDSTTAQYPNMSIFNNIGSAPGGHPSLILGNSRGTMTNPLAVQNGDILGALIFNGTTNPTTLSQAARIEVFAAGNFSSGINPTAMVFSTAPTTGGYYTERLRIDPTGNVGMGTTTPSTTLHVSGTLRIANGGEACDANRTGAIRFTAGQFYVCRNGTTWETMVAGASGNADTDRITSGTTNVITNNNAGISFTSAGIERMGITSNGVGIGIAPAVGLALNVSGNISVVGRLGIVTPIGSNVLVGYTAGSANTGTNNTGFGHSTLGANSGSYNVALGQYAMQNNAGDGGVAVGFVAGQNNTGIGFTGVGYNAGQINTGGYATSIGANAGQFNSGANLSALGSNAAQSNTAVNVVAMGDIAAQLNTGVNLTAVGAQAATRNTGANVTAVGFQAAYNNSANNVTALGYQAANVNSGMNTTAVGYNAAFYNGTGTDNTGLGAYALLYNTNGGSNVAVGRSAGSGTASATAFSGATLLGAYAGQGLTTGGSNTLIGYNAGGGITSGANNLVIGAQTTPFSNTGSNQLNIANAIWGNIGSGTGNANRIGINVTSPTANLEVSGTVSATRFIGDGSLLTGLGGTPDRITSGTNAMVMNTGANGYVSVTSLGDTRITLSGSATGANSLELGQGRTGNGYSYIDLTGDTTYGDYGLRLIRYNAGANAGSYLQHRGTGNLNVETQEAAPIAFLTSGTERMRITSNGNVGIGTAIPGTNLVVSGTTWMGDEVGNGNAYSAGRLNVYKNDGVYGWPAVSGTTDGNVIARVWSGATTLDTGLDANGITWLQARLATNLANNSPLVLQPNGGNVGIGMRAYPSSTLHIAGTGGAGAGPAVQTIDATGSVSFTWGLATRAANLVSGSSVIHVMGKDFSVFNSGYIGFKNIGLNSPNNFMSIGMYSTDHLITANGYGLVGIGVTSPTTKLDINGAIRISEDSGTFAICDANRTGAIRYSSGEFSVCRNGTTWETLTTSSGAASGDRITSGTTSVITYNNASATIATAGVERLIIGTDGRVGLGTQPQTGVALTVSGSAGGNISLLRVDNVSEGGQLNFARASDNQSAWFMDVFGNDFRVFNHVGNGTGNILFATSATEAMRITANGLVGIGTITPSEALHVGNTTNGGRMFVGEDGVNRRGLLLSAASTELNGGGNPPFARIHSYDYSNGRSINLLINPFNNSNGGLVGIGGVYNAPSTTLHLGGSIRIGAEVSATLNVCDANRAGAIKFESPTFYTCSGSGGWQPFGSGGAGASTFASLTDVSSSATAGNIFGPGSLTGATTSSKWTTALGHGALSSSANTGSDNSAFGFGSLHSNTSGNANIALGYGAAYHNTTGQYNMNLGYQAGFNNASGSRNTVVGFQSGLGTVSTSTYSGATLLGSYSGVALTTGNSNTIIGYNAGAGITTGANNLVIGYQTTPFSNTGSNQLNIANALWGNIGSGMGNANKLGINVTSPTTALEVSGTTTTDYLQLVGVSGSAGVSMSGGGGSADNLGNHTATQNLNMAGFSIINATGLSTDRITSGTTGMYAYNNASATIATAGVERMVVGTTGEIGIGQQPSVGNALSVSGNTSLGNAYVAGNLFTGTSQNVNVPWLGGSTATYKQTFTGGNGVNSGLAMVGYNATIADNAPTVTGARSFGTLAAPTAVTANSSLMIMLGSGHDGTNYQKAGAIVIATDASPATNSMPGRIVFSTTAASSVTPTERMRINSSGLVGIGTTAPAYPLDVSGSARIVKAEGLATLDIVNSAAAVAGNGSLIRLITRNAANNGQTAVNLVKYDTGGFVINNGETDALASISMGVGTNNYGIFLDAYNRVAISGTAPTTALDVRGSLRIADGNEACDAIRLGAIKYTTSNFYVCKTAGAWEMLASASGTTVISDRITSGTTGMYTYNNTSATIATAGIERVVIGTTGNVGIGSQPGSNRMTVYGSTAGANGLTVQNASSATNAFATMGLNSDSGSGAINYYSSTWAGGSWAQPNTMELVAYGATTGGLQLRNSTPGGFIRFLPSASIEAMRIVSTGYVGIGTAAPTTPLEVSGTIKTNASVQIANTDTTCATSADYGKIRFDATTKRAFLCRP